MAPGWRRRGRSIRNAGKVAGRRGLSSATGRCLSNGLQLSRSSAFAPHCLANALTRRFVCRIWRCNNCADRRFVIEPADYRAGRALGGLRAEITKRTMTVWRRVRKAALMF